MTVYVYDPEARAMTNVRQKRERPKFGGSIRQHTHFKRVGEEKVQNLTPAPSTKKRLKFVGGGVPPTE